MIDSTRIEEILEKSPDPDNYTIARIVYQKETPGDANRLFTRIIRFVDESFSPAMEYSKDLVSNDHPKFKNRTLNPLFIHTLQSNLNLIVQQHIIDCLLKDLDKDRMIVTLMLKGETRNSGNWPVSPKGSISVDVFNDADRYPSDGQPRKSGMIHVFQLEVPIFLTM